MMHTYTLVHTKLEDFLATFFEILVENSAAAATKVSGARFTNV
jgi:hypothetical protein